MKTIVALAGLMLCTASAVSAEDGFRVQGELTLAIEPDRAFSKGVGVADWWLADHSYSGAADT